MTKLNSWKMKDIGWILDKNPSGFMFEKWSISFERNME